MRKILLLCSAFIPFLLAACDDETPKRVHVEATPGYHAVRIHGRATRDSKGVRDTPLIVAFADSSSKELGRAYTFMSDDEIVDDFDLTLYLPAKAFSKTLIQLDQPLRPGAWLKIEGRFESIWLKSLPDPGRVIDPALTAEHARITFRSIPGKPKIFEFIRDPNPEPYHGPRFETVEPEKKLAIQWKTLAMRTLLSVASFLIGLGLMSHFLRDIFPQQNKESGAFFANGTALCLSALFAIWLFNATDADELISGVAKGLFGVVGSVLDIMFISISAYLLWKKLKAYLS